MACSVNKANVYNIQIFSVQRFEVFVAISYEKSICSHIFAIILNIVSFPLSKCVQAQSVNREVSKLISTAVALFDSIVLSLVLGFC